MNAEQIKLWKTRILASFPFGNNKHQSRSTTYMDWEVHAEEKRNIKQKLPNLPYFVCFRNATTYVSVFAFAFPCPCVSK